MNDFKEEIESVLSLIRHNKVCEKLEDIDVEAYEQAEKLILILSDKLIEVEKDLAQQAGRSSQSDRELMRIEEAIIMADSDFDGDSDHENAADRLVDAVKRLGILSRIL